MIEHDENVNRGFKKGDKVKLTSFAIKSLKEDGMFRKQHLEVITLAQVEDGWAAGCFPDGRGTSGTVYLIRKLTLRERLVEWLKSRK